jgi:hypothetical protein
MYLFLVAQHMLFLLLKVHLLLILPHLKTIRDNLAMVLKNKQKGFSQRNK